MAKAWLVWVMPLLARSPITAERVSEAPARARILAAVAAHPGISTGRLRMLTQMGWGNFHYHLTRLERAGVITITRNGRDRFAFLAGVTDARPLVADRALASETARRVAEAAVKHPGAAVMDIARVSGVSRRMTYYHVGALLDAGLLASGTRTRHLDLRATPDLIERLRERDATVSETQP